MAILTVRNQTGDTRQVDESKVSLAEKDGFVPVVSNGTDEKLVKYSNLELAKKDGFNLLGSQPQQPQEDDGAIHNAFKTILKGAGIAADVIDRLGPAQLRNAFAGTIGMKPETLQAGLEDITGANAPSASDILNYMKVPKANIKMPPIGAENLQNFQTTPKLSEQEKIHQSMTDTGIDTNDLLGLVADFKSQSLVNKTVGGVAQAIPKVGEAVKAVTVKGGSTFTGIPEKNIQTYIEKNPEVKSLISQYGGDMTQAADDLRNQLQKGLRDKVASLNQNIKDIIMKAPPDFVAPKDKIIEALEKAKSGINEKYWPEAANEVQSYIDKVNSSADASGNIKLSEISDAKKFFQDVANGTYTGDGKIFSGSDKMQQAAKQAGREARKLEVGLSPETGEANAELSKIRGLNKNINKNLITPEKSDSALFAAGSGQNLRNVKNLQKVGESTGMDALGEAEKLSSARSFANPDFIPTDSTGKSATRTLLATGIGSLLGGGVGAVLAPILTSPASLKAAIDAGKFSSKAFSALANGAREVTPESFKVLLENLKTEQGQNLIKGAVTLSKWAQNGAKNLQDAGLDQETINGLSKDQLEEASNYKKGSKSMDKFIEKVQPKNNTKEPKSSYNYPMNVRKNGLVATVFGDKDLKEAISEGWSHGMA